MAATARVIWLCACVRYCRPRGWCLSVSLAFFVFHMVQSPLCWRASYALGHPKQRKCKFVALFWMSQWTACSPAWRILYHVTASCKGSIQSKSMNSHEGTCRCNMSLGHVPATFSCVCGCCDFVPATYPCYASLLNIP